MPGDDLARAPIGAAENGSSRAPKGGFTVTFKPDDSSILISPSFLVVPIGSEHITNDLAIGLRTSIEIADRVKREIGNAVPDSIPKREEIDLMDFGAPTSEAVSKRFISEVVHARVEEIFKRVVVELKKIRRDGMLPAGVVLTGGGSKLQGIVEAAKAELRLPAMVGVTHGITSASDQGADPAFSTSVGLLKWGMEMTADSGQGRSMLSRMKPGKVFGGIKKWFKGLMP